ncbi:hypothetical protein ACP52K_004675 [Vibrio alginolyticus]
MGLLILLGLKVNKKSTKTKLKVFYYTGKVIYQCLLKNHGKVDPDLTNEVRLLRDEIFRNVSLEDSVSHVFPSGGKKIMANYRNYRSAKQFGAKMRHVSKFYLDIKSLEQDGVLRRYLSSIEELEKEVEKDIVNRVLKHKKTRKLNQGQIETDLADIQSDELKNIYLSAVEKASDKA